MTKRLTSFALFAILACLSISVTAAIPSGYYSATDGKTTSTLKTALYNIISPHTQLTYNSLWNYFKQTDVHPYPNQDKWWDMYSDVVSYVRNGSSGLNREHSFPKSWWGGTEIPPYTDINHLFPSENDANLAKSNYPLGEVASTTFDNGVTKVGYAESGQGGGATRVFEPADEYKGDFARTYFYMVTCYQTLTWKYLYMLQQNAYPTLKPWAIDLLLKWSREDPVSQKELDRNEAVYTIQNNRNPFIDYPQLAEYIWGNKMGEAFHPSGDTPTGDPVLIAPTSSTTLDFSEVAIGSSQKLGLLVKGENLTGYVSVDVYSGDSQYFTTTVSSIQATKINNADGYLLQLEYKPTVLGKHSSKVVLSEGGIPGTGVGVVLTGECLPVPTLSQLTANPAENIVDNTYRASWNAASENIDYYVVTRSIYNNGNVSTNEYTADENFYDFDDLQSGTTQTYYVQSSRLGYRSVPSNTITVSSGSVTGVTEDAGIAAINIDGGVRFVCSEAHTNGQVFNALGQLVKIIPTINNGDILEMPYGAYFVVTTESKKPIKILIQ